MRQSLQQAMRMDKYDDDDDDNPDLSHPEVQTIPLSRPGVLLGSRCYVGIVAIIDLFFEYEG